MVQMIVGKKGKGKTKFLLEKANTISKHSNGSLVYLDKSADNMYELSNRIRLISLSDFPIVSREGFIGFICGIISQDHDLEVMFLDSFLKLSHLENEDISDTIKILEDIGETYHITFILSVSLDAVSLPDSVQKHIIISL